MHNEYATYANEVIVKQNKTTVGIAAKVNPSVSM